MKNQKPYIILVVDDDPATLCFLEKHLAIWKYRVMTSENGHQGITAVQSHRPDMVITNFSMQNGTGVEFVNHISDTLPELPFIAIAGQSQPDDIIQAFRLGARDFICKPIDDLSFLRKTIEKVLEKVRLTQESLGYCNYLEELVKQKNTELLNSEKHYRTVADFIYDWEYWVAPSGQIVYISPSCERITGYQSREFINNPSILSEIIHPEDRSVFKQHLEESHFHKETCHLSFRIKRRDGERRWIGHSCQPVSDSQGTYLGRRCSNRDITYQKTIENDLIEQRQVLMEKTISQAKSNEALKALLDQREIEKRAIEQSMVVNLKRFVFPYLEELERHKIGEDIRTYVNIIRTNIEQLVSPISKSLSTVYLDLTPTEIKVADLIRQGKSTKMIAAILNNSPSTVEKHRNKIRKKLNMLNKNKNLYSYLKSFS